MLQKKYNALETEKRISSYWSEKQVYKFDPLSSGPVYSIDTPPPTVSGHLHIGHIFSYNQAEIIARYRRMQGDKVFYPFGFDDNGLPTERLVERDLGLFAKDMDRQDFVKACLESTKNYEDEFKALWRMMGISCDWNLAYRTIGESSQRISQRSFIDLAKKGLAYREESPVIWCHHCQTSIAQAELETVEKDSHFVTIEFSSEAGPLYIATTRPEMLFACVAVLAHPDDDRYKDLPGDVTVPLYDFEVPIIYDENVSMDKGTGLVMTCTFGDMTDLEWYKAYDFELKQIISESGHIASSVPLIGGMYLTKARKKMIDFLTEAGVLSNIQAIKHSVSVHDRCSTPVEILTSNQWYINVLNDKDRYLKAADQINWYPSHMKKRYLLWVENLKWNWCISRQRYYGVPIPVWYCQSCGQILFPNDEDLPVNPVTDKPKPCACGSNDYIGETAVLDTWATSSVSPEINDLWLEEKPRNLGKMTLRSQAHEIIRTWTFYTIVKSLAHHNRLPWKDIMISGFVLAKKGEKISKSKQNAKLTPHDLIKKHSADVIRYWTSSAKLGTDTFFKEEDLKVAKRFVTKLWNASKFSLMMLKDFQIKDLSKVQMCDEWIIHRYHQTVDQAKMYLDQYELGLARQSIDNFFWHDFCDNYLEYVKDRLYKRDIYNENRFESGRQALYYTMLGILKLYAIYTPFVTEEIYQSYFKALEADESLHTSSWTNEKADDLYLKRAGRIHMILSEVRKYKSERHLSMKDEIRSLLIYTKDSAFIEACLKDLYACLHVKSIEIIESPLEKIEISIDQPD